MSTKSEKAVLEDMGESLIGPILQHWEQFLLPGDCGVGSYVLARMIEAADNLLTGRPRSDKIDEDVRRRYRGMSRYERNVVLSRLMATMLWTCVQWASIAGKPLESDMRIRVDYGMAREEWQL